MRILRRQLIKNKFREFNANETLFERNPLNFVSDEDLDSLTQTQFQDKLKELGSFFKGMKTQFQENVIEDHKEEIVGEKEKEKEDSKKPDAV